MADDRPDLLVPDRRIVSIEEAKKDLGDRKAGKGGGDASNFISRKEMLRILEGVEAGISQGVLAVGQKMYDQTSEELAENFEALEQRILLVIAREFQRRTLRGRLLERWLRLGDWLIAKGWMTPRPAAEMRLVDAVEALEPTVAAATADDVVHTHAP